MISVVTLSKGSVDPDRISKSSNYDDEFRIDIHFKDLCLNCKSTDAIEDKCNWCRKRLEEDLSYWQIIQQILRVKLVCSLVEP